MIDLCVHSHVGVLATDPVIWIGHCECVECAEIAFGVGGGHVLSVLMKMADRWW